MIAYLHGKIAQLDPTFVVIDCGGIGYLAKISLTTYTNIQGKETIKLYTYLQVREDAHILYGFSEEKEKVLFEQLISVSGVGGNTAIVILSSVKVKDFYQAIQMEDIATLKRIKGIGAKTAGRMILELKDKIKIDGLSLDSKSGASGIAPKRAEAIIALTNLGFPKTTMEKRVDQILKKIKSDISVEEIIKRALKNP